MAKTPQNLRVIDLDTGEELPPGNLIYVPDRARIKEPWLVTFQSALMHLATDAELTGQTLKVLLGILACTDFENRLHINQAILAKRLRMPRQRVNDAFGVLKAKGIITKTDATDTQPPGYTVSPNHAWRGNTKLLYKARKTSLPLHKQQDIKHLQPMTAPASRHPAASDQPAAQKTHKAP